VAACGGGISGGGSASKASSSFCKAFASDWSQLQAAMQSAYETYVNSQGGAVDPSAISQELSADQSTYQRAAATASSLGAKAPTALTNDITTDTENVRQRFTTIAAAFTAASKLDGSQLDSLDQSQFDEGSTGCEFDSSGPDGKVSKLFGS
jgi:hypothetical protein